MKQNAKRSYTYSVYVLRLWNRVCYGRILVGKVGARMRFIYYLTLRLSSTFKRPYVLEKYCSYVFARVVLITTFRKRLIVKTWKNLELRWNFETWRTKIIVLIFSVLYSFSRYENLTRIDMKVYVKIKNLNRLIDIHEMYFTIFERFLLNLPIVRRVTQK